MIQIHVVSPQGKLEIRKALNEVICLLSIFSHTRLRRCCRLPRCANGGFTCVVDKFGRITTPLITPDTAQEILIASVPLLSSTEHEQTLYTRYGDWFPILCALICVGWFGSQIIMRVRHRHS
jgi:hypothetical protein